MSYAALGATCGEGQMADPVTGLCISAAPCPSDEVWNPAAGGCVPAAPRAAAKPASAAALPVAKIAGYVVMAAMGATALVLFGSVLGGRHA